MSYAAHAADDRPRGPWCAQSYRYGPPWHPGMIVLTILGFVLWWPLGLAMLFFVLWSKGMLCWGHGGAHWQNKMERMQEKMDRMRGKMERAWGPASSGNRAFDDYRAETLRRLEDEEKEFREFLTRLRAAKDKAEFDQFMSERRNRPGAGPAPEPTAG
jgi:hypothetical protein